MIIQKQKFVSQFFKQKLCKAKDMNFYLLLTMKCSQGHYCELNMSGIKFNDLELPAAGSNLNHRFKFFIKL